MEEHASKLRRALWYPKVSGAVILMLAIFNHKSDMPYVALAVYAAAAVFVLGRRYLHVFRYWTDRLLLGIPVLGTLIEQHSFARFAESLALTFESGINLREGLEVAAACVPNLVIREAVEDTVPRLNEGHSLYRAFQMGGRMDRLSLYMLKAGEDSGNLAHTLRELTGWYDRKTDEALTALHQVAGPAMTILMGGMVYAGL